MANLLDEELDALVQNEESNSEETIQEATLLLEAPKENTQIFEALNMTYQINKAKDSVDKSNRKKLYQRYSSKVYTGEQIQELCNTYDLKMLQARHYKGKLEMEMAKVLKEFSEKHNVQITMGQFFILSTRESFYENTNKSDNCILLFREGDRDNNEAQTEQMFAVVHSWGQTITASRRNRFLFYGHIDGDKLPSAMATVISVILWLITFFISGMVLSTILIVIAAIIFFANCINEKYYDKKWNHIERK